MLSIGFNLSRRGLDSQQAWDHIASPIANHELCHPLLNELKAGVGSYNILRCKLCLETNTGPRRVVETDGRDIDCFANLRVVHPKVDSIAGTARVWKGRATGDCWLPGSHRSIPFSKIGHVFKKGACSVWTQFTMCTGKQVGAQEQCHWSPHMQALHASRHENQCRPRVQVSVQM
jgi:hypothetical protein